MLSSSRVTVSLPNRSYDVVIGAGILEQGGELLRQIGLNRPVAVVTDERVDRIYGDKLIGALAASGFSTSLHIGFGGDPPKPFATAEEVHQTWARTADNRS